ncbi:YhgE/Pip family protein [Peribacillus deserti]|uniref:YhgE/Pip domain-containing protein n=1 Tax=Peribacillus deserti TaxID=673318 RepID=A0A2N5M9J3_9BACI|nr:YhgE/Pip domain-containing protein [Peribacillus deserti]PLT31027.1 YhgE/Pip domain-containing protein [Peribacillus deserti]
MKGFGSQLSELMSRKGVMISLTAVLLVPLIYAAIILTPSWGPYDNLSNLPVAVVNKDKGAMSGDEEINIGRDLVDDLKKSKALGWDFVDAGKADEGLKDLKYYMVVQIPETFSADAITVMDESPKKPEIKYIQNEGLHFLAAKVTTGATEKLREQLGNKITESYVKNLFANMEKIASGFKNAADGSIQLNNGSTELRAGTGKILSSLKEKSPDIDKLAAGSQQLQAGTQDMVQSLQAKSGSIAELAAGTKTLENGTGQLLQSLQDNSEKINQLSTGAKDLKAGLDTLKGGTAGILGGIQSVQGPVKDISSALNDRLAPGSESLKDAVGTIADGAPALSGAAKGVLDGLKAMAAKNPALLQDPGFQKMLGTQEAVAGKLAELAVKAPLIKKGAQDIAGGLNQVAPGMSKISEGVNTLAAKQAELDKGAQRLAAGAAQLADGNATVNKSWGTLTSSVAQLKGGAAKISDGNQQVDSGWKTLTAGAGALNNGMQQVSAGTQTVKTGWSALTDGVAQVDNGVGKLEDGSSQLASGLKDGADETGSINAEAANLAMFSSPVELDGKVVNKFPLYRYANAPYILSLALFVGILVMSFFFDLRKPAETAVSAVRWYAGRFGSMAALAIAQALIISIFSLMFIKLNFSNSIGLILFSVLASLTFLTIVFFFVSAAGNIGRFIALAFLVLQLSTTGSSLPIDLLPENLRALSSFLPLTYSIGGFKSIITLHNTDFIWDNTGTLVVYLAIFAVLGAAIALLRSRKTDGKIKLVA